MMDDKETVGDSIQSTIQQEFYRNYYQEGLLEDVLPFWMTHGVDHQYGGVLTCLDQTGKVIDTDKAVWQQGRFCWLLGELYNTYLDYDPVKREQWLSVAEGCAKYLDQYCTDDEDGRMWFHLTREGQPIRKRRYAFSESFAAIAYAELAKARDESSYANKSIEFFRKFIERSRHQDLSSQKFTNTRPSRSIGYPMITLITAQEMRDAIQFDEANHWIDESIEQIVQFHFKPEHRCVVETVALDGEIIDHFDGRTLNPGHAIEASWFIMQEGMYRKDQGLMNLGRQILDWMWARGWDQEFGGMLYFTDLFGHPVQEYWHDMKFWWPHNEAIIATLMAYVITKDVKYASWHKQVHDWSYQHFPDPTHGEWFGYLDRTGRVTSTAKGNYWKGPFHLPRMQLTCSQLLASEQV